MSAGTKIFVYGVNRSCPKDVLEDKFGKFGIVSDVYITDKGYAFVTMDNDSEAQAAIDDLNGSDIDGQQVKVEVAHGRGGTSRGGRGGGDRRGGYGFGGDRRGGYGGGRFGGERRGYGGGGEGGYRGERSGGYERRGYGGGGGDFRRSGGYDEPRY